MTWSAQTPRSDTAAAAGGDQWNGLRDVVLLLWDKAETTGLRTAGGQGCEGIGEGLRVPVSR